MGRFVKGQSGNPAGRKPGTKTKVGKLRAAIDAYVPEIVEAMATAARSGDTAAAKLLLDRALPPLRPVDTPTPLGVRGASADLSGAATAVLEALRAGSITPDQAGTIAGALSALVRVRESTELEARIAALENRTDGTAAKPR